MSKRTNNKELNPDVPPCKGRVRRSAFPEYLSPIRKTTYRKKSLRFLKVDFKCRCAYCMKPLGSDSDMDVDHFDPRRKNDRIQLYANLFLADKRCNYIKSDHWPSAEASAAGARFLNCCEEVEYGVCIFEDPETHKLVGTTPAAKYHIKIIDLDAPELIEARRVRSDYFASKAKIETMSKSDANVKRAVALLEPYIKQFIPAIPPPPCPG